MLTGRSDDRGTSPTQDEKQGPSAILAGAARESEDILARPGAQTETDSAAAGKYFIASAAVDPLRQVAFADANEAALFHATGLLKLAAPASTNDPRALVSDRIDDPSAPAKTGNRGRRWWAFLAGLLMFHVANSITVVTMNSQIIQLKKAALLAQHHGIAMPHDITTAASYAMWTATITGLLRIPGNNVGTWLSYRMENKHIAVLAGVLRAMVLAAAFYALLHHVAALPVLWTIYGIDAFVSGFEDVTRETLRMELAPNHEEGLSLNSHSQTLVELSGMAPLGLAVFGLSAIAAAGIAPWLFVAAAILFLLIPKASQHISKQQRKVGTFRSQLQIVRDILREPLVFLPLLGMIILSAYQLKNPISASIASSLIQGDKATINYNTNLISGIFGAGSVSGAMAGRVRAISFRSWMALAAILTVLWALSWFTGILSAGAALPAIATMTFLFAFAMAAARVSTNTALQDGLRKRKKTIDTNTALGLSRSGTNFLSAALRVMMGTLLSLFAAPYMGFGALAVVLIAFAVGFGLVAWNARNSINQRANHNPA